MELLSNKIFSIHSLYSELHNKTHNLAELLTFHNIGINDIYSCCGTHHTLLSYSLSKKDIHIFIILDLLKHNADFGVMFKDNRSPLYYLCTKQPAYIIKIILQCIMPIQIEKIDNINLIINTLIDLDKKKEFIFLTNQCCNLLLSDKIINKMIMNNKKEWLYESCIVIYYNLILASENSIVNILCDEVKLKIYKYIFLYQESENDVIQPIIKRKANNFLQIL